MGSDFVEAREKLREMILKYGVAGSDIINQVHSEIFRLDIPELWKVRLADEWARWISCGGCGRGGSAERVVENDSYSRKPDYCSCHAFPMEPFKP
jgi:hypothetical protein